MAVAKMTKVMVVAHHSQATELLDAVQQEGILQVLDAAQAMVTKDWPELVTEAQRPRQIEELLGRLEKNLTFLDEHTTEKKTLAAVLAPRMIVDHIQYSKVVSGKEALETLADCEKTAGRITELKTQIENCLGRLETLEPWQGLKTPVEQLGNLRQVSCLVGFLPEQNFQQLSEKSEGFEAVLDVVGTRDHLYACIIVCLKENYSDVRKILRTADFEAVNFEGLEGTAAELIKQERKKFETLKKQLAVETKKAEQLSKNRIALQILFDHYRNLSSREQTRISAPATEHTILLEGWIRRSDYGRLRDVVSQFSAASVSEITPAEDEEIPIEIENNRVFRPFEVITRLYGMPHYFEVDPTAFLAPFFALFFGLCLTDAGYGLIILAISIFFIKRMQGDKKLMWMLGICSVATIIAGALMGGWFGDAVQKFVPALEPIRQSLMLFDPMKYPLKFFTLSLVLGYIQIMAGLLIAFVYDLKRKLYIAAICDRFTWLVMLNSIVVFALAKTGKLPVHLSSVFGYSAFLSAMTIFLFSHRQGGWGSRLGMGFYNLFSALFYIGDVLSYLRLMALGLVTAGLAMAINQIAQLAYELPFGIGVVLAIAILIGGHLFNLGINALGAFVHTLRLQYAEFFPKFFSGGGLPFQPLTKKYKHIYIKKTQN